MTDELYAAYQAGATLRDVAQAHGTTVQAVQQRFARAGLVVRKPGTRQDSGGASSLIIGVCACGAPLYGSAAEGWELCRACGYERWEGHDER